MNHDLPVLTGRLGCQTCLMSIREYAAIHLRVPDSGNPEIDAMIRRAIEPTVAAQKADTPEQENKPKQEAPEMQINTAKVHDAFLADDGLVLVLDRKLGNLNNATRGEIETADCEWCFNKVKDHGNCHSVFLPGLHEIVVNTGEEITVLPAKSTPAEKPEQEAPAVQMKWRDARPEDAGKGLVCRVRDYDNNQWSEYVVGTTKQRILKEHNNDNPYSWKTDIGTSWRFCQVYAPVEQPAQVEPTPTDEGWRPFEECPDGVIVEFNGSAHWSGRVIGQRFDGSAYVYVFVEGNQRPNLYKLYPTHFRTIGGGK